MVQVTGTRETDGGAVFGHGLPAAAAGDVARDGDRADVMIPTLFVADVTDVADVGLDLVVGIMEVPGGTRIEIVVRGELDLATAPALRVAVAGACRAEVGLARAVVIVLDLADVTFMDSSALHALADIDAQVQRRGWSLRVTPPAGRSPRRLLLLAARRRWLPRWRTGLAATGSATTQRADTLLPQRPSRCDGHSVSPTAGSAIA